VGAQAQSNQPIPDEDPCQPVQVDDAHNNSKGHQKSWVRTLPLERLIRTPPHDRRHAFAIIPATDPQVPRLRAPAVDGLAPAIIHTAEFDPVRDEGAAYAVRLERGGVPPIHRSHSADHPQRCSRPPRVMAAATRDAWKIRLSDYERLSLPIDEESAAVHWRARTGAHRLLHGVLRTVSAGYLTVWAMRLSAVEPVPG
jgi:hypothetical protein